MERMAPREHSVSTVSFSISVLLHCLHTHHAYSTGIRQRTWENLYGNFMVLVSIWRVFFFKKKSFFCVSRGTQRTLTDVQPVVPRYWPGYQWYRGIRTTLGQHSIAECRFALGVVYLQKPIGIFFVVVQSDSCDFVFRGVVVLLCCQAHHWRFRSRHPRRKDSEMASQKSRVARNSRPQF